MNKKFTVLWFVLLVSFSVNAQYVRKLKEPDFFIPESDRMHKVEKLPLIKAKDINVKKIVYSEPLYKKKYNEYLKDISIFKKTKIMPKNEILKNDLAAMSHGDVFEVEDYSFDYRNNSEYVKFKKVLHEILSN